MLLGNVWVGDNPAGASHRVFLFRAFIPYIAVEYFRAASTISVLPVISDSLFKTFLAIVSTTWELKFGITLDQFHIQLRFNVSTTSCMISQS